MSVAQLKDRVDLLCQLIEWECQAAHDAGPAMPDGMRNPIFGSLRALKSQAHATRRAWEAASLQGGLDVCEALSKREQRARLLEALTDPASMGAYGAPVELGPDTPAGPVITLPAGWACVPPTPGFDREAFRREAALRMLETEKGRHGPADAAARSVVLADALIAALEGPPRGT